MTDLKIIKMHSILIGVLYVILLSLIILLFTKDISSLTGDININIKNKEVKGYIESWIEENDQIKMDDNYTVSEAKPNQKGEIQSFLIQCKTGYICRGPEIIKIDINISTGEVVNVLYPKK